MRAAAVAISTALLAAPFVALAFPFGGQIFQAVPCYNDGAIFAAVGPPRGGDYIWTPSTKTYQFGPPTHAGQWLLGLAGAPYFCIVSIDPVNVWAGIYITMMGSSDTGGAAAIAALLATNGASLPASPAPAPQFQPPYNSGNYVAIPPAQNQGAGRVLISEVFYNVDAAHGSMPLNQWVELYNGSGSPADVSGWTLQNATMQTALPQGTMIPASGFLVLVATSGTASFWRIPSGADVAALRGSVVGSLSASGDALILRDGSGARVDSVSWGTNASAFSPSVPPVNPGFSIARKSLVQDTDSGNDWAPSSVPTPGQ